jgi:hypothetical protein
VMNKRDPCLSGPMLSIASRPLCNSRRKFRPPPKLEQKKTSNEILTCPGFKNVSTQNLYREISTQNRMQTFHHTLRKRLHTIQKTSKNKKAKQTKAWTNQCEFMPRALKYFTMNEFLKQSSLLKSECIPHSYLIKLIVVSLRLKLATIN